MLRVLLCVLAVSLVVGCASVPVKNPASRIPQQEKQQSLATQDPAWVAEDEKKDDALTKAQIADKAYECVAKHLSYRSERGVIDHLKKRSWYPKGSWTRITWPQGKTYYFEVTRAMGFVHLDGNAETYHYDWPSAEFQELMKTYLAFHRTVFRDDLPLWYTVGMATATSEHLLTNCFNVFHDGGVLHDGYKYWQLLERSDRTSKPLKGLPRRIQAALAPSEDYGWLRGPIMFGVLAYRHHCGYVCQPMIWKRLKKLSESGKKILPSHIQTAIKAVVQRGVVHEQGQSLAPDVLKKTSDQLDRLFGHLALGPDYLYQ